MTRQVDPSEDLARIVQLPRRRWSPDAAREVVDTLTALHRTPTGSMRLHEHQAIALAEIGIYGGAFLPLPVGAGKTAISLLAPAMRPEIKRPLLLTHAPLIEKTIRDEADLRKHWILPVLRRIESYEKLSRVSAAAMLEDYAPDLVIVDEAHALKNRDSARTRRVFRYLHAHPDVLLVVLTGSPIGTSIHDIAHLMGRALGARSPLPRSRVTLEQWAGALDVNVPAPRRFAPGALLRLAEPGETVYGAVCRRIMETPGVVSMRGQTIEIPIRIRSHVAPFCAAQTRAMEDLRTTGATPDGEIAEDASAIWRHAREISLGFYSVWDPRPPREWIEARRCWQAWCRDVIGSNRRDIDSAEQLALHLARHPEHYPEAAEALARWRALEPTFKPNPVARWISGETIDWIGKWIASSPEPAIVWTDRPAFGEALRAILGIPYYGEEGIDAVSGAYIGDARGRTIATSSRAGSTGHNLQAFARNLCTDIPSTPIPWEQRIGRTHRPGQRAERIEVDLLFGVLEDARAFASAQAFAARVQALTGQAQKLCLADATEVAAPWDLEGLDSPRWKRAIAKPLDFGSGV